MHFLYPRRSNQGPCCLKLDFTIYHYWIGKIKFHQNQTISSRQTNKLENKPLSRIGKSFFRKESHFRFCTSSWVSATFANEKSCFALLLLINLKNIGKHAKLELNLASGLYCLRKYISQLLCVQTVVNMFKPTIEKKYVYASP